MKSYTFYPRTPAESRTGLFVLGVLGSVVAAGVQLAGGIPNDDPTTPPKLQIETQPAKLVDAHKRVVDHYLGRVIFEQNAEITFTPNTAPRAGAITLRNPIKWSARRWAYLDPSSNKTGTSVMTPLKSDIQPHQTQPVNGEQGYESPGPMELVKLPVALVCYKGTDGEDGQTCYLVITDGQGHDQATDTNTVGTLIPSSK